MYEIDLSVRCVEQRFPSDELLFGADASDKLIKGVLTPSTSTHSNIPDATKNSDANPASKDDFWVSAPVQHGKEVEYFIDFHDKAPYVDRVLLKWAKDGATSSSSGTRVQDDENRNMPSEWSLSVSVPGTGLQNAGADESSGGGSGGGGSLTWFTVDARDISKCSSGEGESEACESMIDASVHRQDVRAIRISMKDTRCSKEIVGGTLSGFKSSCSPDKTFRDENLDRFRLKTLEVRGNLGERLEHDSRSFALFVGPDGGTTDTVASRLKAYEVLRGDLPVRSTFEVRMTVAATAAQPTKKLPLALALLGSADLSAEAAGSAAANEVPLLFSFIQHEAAPQAGGRFCFGPMLDASKALEMGAGGEDNTPTHHVCTIGKNRYDPTSSELQVRFVYRAEERLASIYVDGTLAASVGIPTWRVGTGETANQRAMRDAWAKIASGGFVSFLSQSHEDANMGKTYTENGARLSNFEVRGPQRRKHTILNLDASTSYDLSIQAMSDYSVAPQNASASVAKFTPVDTALSLSGAQPRGLDVLTSYDRDDSGDETADLKSKLNADFFDGHHDDFTVSAWLKVAPTRENTAVWLPWPDSGAYPSVRDASVQSPRVYRSCRDARDAGHAESGMYRVSDTSTSRTDPFTEVYCEMTLVGGGWTLVAYANDNGGNWDIPSNADMRPEYEWNAGNYGWDGMNGATNSFYRNFEGLGGYGEVMFMTGNMKKWCVLPHEDLTAPRAHQNPENTNDLSGGALGSDPYAGYGTHWKSAHVLASYGTQARRNARTLVEFKSVGSSYPRVQCEDSTSINSAKLLWAEGGYSSAADSYKNANNGVGMFVRPSVGRPRSSCLSIARDAMDWVLSSEAFRKKEGDSPLKVVKSASWINPGTPDLWRGRTSAARFIDLTCNTQDVTIANRGFALMSPGFVLTQKDKYCSNGGEVRMPDCPNGVQQCASRCLLLSRDHGSNRPPSLVVRGFRMHSSSSSCYCQHYVGESGKSGSSNSDNNNGDSSTCSLTSDGNWDRYDFVDGGALPAGRQPTVATVTTPEVYYAREGQCGNHYDDRATGGGLVAFTVRTPAGRTFLKNSIQPRASVDTVCIEEGGSVAAAMAAGGVDSAASTSPIRMNPALEDESLTNEFDEVGGAGGDATDIEDASDVRGIDFGVAAMASLTPTQLDPSLHPQRSTCSSSESYVDDSNVASQNGAEITLQCPLGTRISGVAFASFGNPRGTCGSNLFADLSCHAPSSEQVVQKICLGRQQCKLPNPAQNEAGARSNV